MNDFYNQLYNKEMKMKTKDRCTNRKDRYIKIKDQYNKINHQCNIIYRNFNNRVQRYMENHKKILLILGMICIFISPIFFARKSVDNDVWFLLNSGRYILNHGFTSIEPFSIHEGLAFSFQQGLTDVYFYGVYKMGGEKLLIAVIMAESILMLLLYYRLCKIVSDGHTGQSMLSTLLFSGVSSIFMTTRPQVSSFIILILELIILEKWVRTQRHSFLFFLPILSVLEINLHAATWWMLFIFMMPYLFELKWIKGERIKPDQYRKKPLILAALGMFLSGLCNPYGVDNILYLIKSQGTKYSAYVGEMKPCTYETFGMYLIIGVSIVLLVHHLRSLNVIKLRYVYLYIGTIFMTIVNQRSEVFFAMAAFMITAYEFKQSKVTHFSIAWLFCYMEIVVGVYLVFAHLKPDESYENILKEHRQILSYLQNCASKDVHLFTDYNTGGLYEFEGYPCFIDARMEVYLKSMNGVKNFFDEYVEVEAGVIYYQDFLEQYDFDYYIFDKSRGFYVNVSHDNRYRCLYETGQYALFEKR